MKKNGLYHLALCPDGNRRWADKKRLPTFEGHLKGYQNLLNFWEWCRKRKIRVLTVFAFSSENWRRSKKEINYLMKLIEKGLLENIKKYQKDRTKVIIIGQREKLPKFLQRTIGKIEALTKNYENFQLNIAISYGGRWDITQAIQKIVKEGISPKNITENLVAKYVSTAGLPEPDLVIRTGGEHRLSNFLLWQLAYSEIYFSNKNWPDFTEADLDEALEEYARRKRRFGR